MIHPMIYLCHTMATITYLPVLLHISINHKAHGPIHYLVERATERTPCQMGSISTVPSPATTFVQPYSHRILKQPCNQRFHAGSKQSLRCIASNHAHSQSSAAQVGGLSAAIERQTHAEIQLPATLCTHTHLGLPSTFRCNSKAVTT